MTLKTWLSLTLAVSLAHLALLQTMPLSLNMAHNEATSSFVTRTLVLPDATPPAPAKGVTATPALPKPKAAPRISQRLEQQPVAATEPGTPADSAVPIAAVSIPATEAATDNASASLRVVAMASTTSSPAPQPGAASPARAAAFNAQSLPGSVKLVYRVDSNKFPYRLQTELLWQQHDQTYQARMSFGAFGLARVQSSRGRIDEHGLAPDRFSDKFRSEVAAHFNRQLGVVTFSANTPNLPLQPGAQDRLSVLLQLAALVASAPRSFAPGTTLSIQTIGPRDGEQWSFTFGDIESLELPGGQLRGLKLVRQPRHPYDQTIEVWLAPDLSFLPARIRITETNGDFVDQKWQASEAADSP